MVTLTINGQVLQVEKGATILEAAAQADIHIPHLCYLKGLNEIAACRVCCVEVEGERAMVTACNTPVREGMVVHTNSPRARATRRTNVELILSQHDCKCATCVRSGSCHLQSVANDLGILTLPYETQLPQGLRKAWTTTFPLYHDYNKCIKCMRCIQVCEKIQTLGIWDLAGTGGRTTIDVSGNRVIKDSDCALCGQCITHCPVGGLRERDDTQRAFDALADPDKITVVQVAPAVRTAWGEYFDMPREQATIERMAAVLRRLGFDYVFDTNFSADLTIMEEGSEFLRRLKVGGLERWPMFTSCCPGWVRFLKRLGAVFEEPVPGAHRTAVHRQVPPADVRQRHQELVCPKAGGGSGEDLLRVHHAMCGQEGGVRAAHHAHGNRARRGPGAHHPGVRADDPGGQIESHGPPSAPAPACGRRSMSWAEVKSAARWSAAWATPES